MSLIAFASFRYYLANLVFFLPSFPAPPCLATPKIPAMLFSDAERHDYVGLLPPLTRWVACSIAFALSLYLRRCSLLW